ncbi:MAG: YlxR family protein [Pseudoclavibacter sp.]
MSQVRTCIGCRSHAERSQLLRIVSRDGRLLVDGSARQPGRGAWVHPLVDCIEPALARRAFGRALRCAVSNEDGVRDLVHQLAADQTAARNEKADRTMDNS